MYRVLIIKLSLYVWQIVYILNFELQTCLRHPDCPSARENRDTVFCQMRRAMDLIHYVVKDGVLDSAAQLAQSGVNSPVNQQTSNEVMTLHIFLPI